MSPPTRTAPRPATLPAPARSGRGRVIAAVLAGTVLLAAVGYVVAFTGVVGVTTVSVTGVRALTADQVRTAAAVRTGEPLARVDLGGVSERVRRLAGVERVAVTRSWPHTVRITVTERRGVAVVTRDGANWLVDPAGVVFQRLAGRPKLPLLDIPAVGQRNPAARAALTAVTALKPQLRAAVLRVRAPTAEQVTMLLSNGSTVLWGGAEESAAKAIVLAELVKRPGKHYDVSTPSVVTVR